MQILVTGISVFKKYKVSENYSFNDCKTRNIPLFHGHTSQYCHENDGKWFRVTDIKQRHDEQALFHLAVSHV